MKIAEADLFRYRLPLTEPLRLAGDTITQRQGYLLRLITSEGTTAWGDAAPLPGFSAESLAETEAVLIRAVPRLRGAGLAGKNFDVFRDESLFEDQSDLANCSAYFAIESAMIQLLGQTGGESIPFPGKPPSTTLRLNVLLPATEDIDQLREHATKAREAGYAAVKLKVGVFPLHDDIQRTRAVREVIGPNVALRLDANRAWDAQSAFIFAQAIKECYIEYIEEPVDDPVLLPEFLATTGTPYALDETLQRPADVLMRGEDLPGGDGNALEFFGVLLRDAAAWVWKPTLLQRPIVDTALQLNRKKPVVLSSAFESGVGLAAITRYAAAYSGAGVPVGLDTYRFLAEDVLMNPLPLDRPEIKVGDVVAAGALVDLDRIEAVS